MIKKITGYLLCLPFYAYFKTYENIYLMLIYILKKRKGLKLLDVRYEETKSNIFIDIYDTGITREILTINLKEPLNSRNFAKILTSNEITNIIDLGANIGDFVIFESNYSKAKILAIEPVSRNFEVLRLNILRNNLDKQVRTLKVAAGDKNGFAKIYIPQRGNWSSLYKNKFIKQNDPFEQTKTVTLAQLFSENKIPRKNVLIRTDIEGFEYNLIKGNQDFLKELQNSWFCLEFHNQILSKKQCIELLQIMKSCGFQIRIMSHESPLWLGFFRNSAIYLHIKRFYKWKTNNNFIDITREKPSFEDVMEDIMNNRYIYGPHINFYKK